MATFRKIIQISATEAPDTARYEGGTVLLALCNDGSIWSKHNAEEWFLVDTSFVEQAAPQVDGGSEHGG